VDSVRTKGRPLPTPTIHAEKEKEKKERNHKTLFYFSSKCSEDENDETGPADQYIWNWHDDFLVSQSELYHHLYFSALSM
jgi:hypothetical protein